jgi:ribonuclease HI
MFYAVANGITPGIFTNWDDCSASVKGYRKAVYKKFDTREGAALFIQAYNSIEQDASLVDTQLRKTTDEYTPDYYVYTDGACSNNGKENAVAGIGIFFGIDDECNVSRRVIGKQTNNVAELTAIVETYFIISDDVANGKRVAIVSDSEYAIKCVSSYGEKCSKLDWRSDIPNKDLVKKAYELYKDMVGVRFIHVAAHTSNTDVHSLGNDNADRLANLAIGLDSCPYSAMNHAKLFSK